MWEAEVRMTFDTREAAKDWQSAAEDEGMKRDGELDESPEPEEYA